MAAVLTSPPLPSALFRTDSEGLTTLPDPKSPSPGSAASLNGSVDSNQHPDLSNEVALLSAKLINAINYQTNLDDSLQHTRHELDAARERLEQLESAARQHAEMMEKGLLIEKDVFDKMETRFKSELAEERKRRVEAENNKRKQDGEVEVLTSALFEEANGMVAAARKDTETAEKRSEQLKQQLSDTEMLLTSHQEQLQDLKAVMQQMSSDRDENDTSHTSTAPSTPALIPADKINRLFESANLTPNTPGADDVQPDHPLRFSHLIHPVLRSDLHSYKEFQEMLKISRSSAPSSRVSSGNYGALNVMGLGSLAKNHSTTSLPTVNASGSPRDSLNLGSNLKDEKFYKRALAEDIEPTLRLDIAPGLSWNARRTVRSSITAGSLVVEPHPPIPKFRGPVFPCSLCGENRKAEEYTRKHRFRVSETDDSSYPLCDHCLGRLRATCDYIGFLRMVAAGHWRAETEDDRKSAWEESVRLRERMFWTRVGGGVVPAVVPVRDSPRSPAFNRTNSNEKGERKSEESLAPVNGTVDSAVDVNESNEAKSQPKEYDPFRSNDPQDKAKRVSIGKTVIHPAADASESLDSDEERKIEHEAASQLENEVRQSIQSRASTWLDTPISLDEKSEDTDLTTVGPSSPRLEKQRLSVTIPGAFE